MNKFIKVILVAAIAMGGMTMEAKELTDAQKAEVKAIALVAKLEGYRSYWYNCSAGVQTIGYGFTKSVLTKDEQALKSMDRKTADRILGREIRKIQKDVRKLVTRKMTVDQEVAVISFVYNLGLPKFKSSTLLKRINDGSDSAVVVAELKKWVYASGKVSKGLKNRRETESKYWLA